MHAKIPVFAAMHVNKHAFFAVPASHKHAAFFKCLRETSSP